MFRNYLTVALRNLVRHKLYSVINIAGLAVGLACVIFVALFVRDELSYDKWIPDTQNLYRLELSIFVPGRPPMDMAAVPYPMPATMQSEIPGVTAATQMNLQYSTTLIAGDKQFVENLDVVDPNFFTLIKLPFVIGDSATAFRDPQSVVLSQSAAKKYFGDANPIGRTLSTIKSGCADTDLACQHTMINLTVTGVIRDLPHNTQLAGDIFIPDTSLAFTMPQEQKHQWLSNNGWGFIRLAPGVTPQSVLARMPPILDRTVTPELKKYGVSAMGSKVYTVHMTPFDQVHLDSSRWQFNQTPPGSWTTVYGVIAIGILILLVACFNFMNLSTARAAMRAREIALRKTMGARRGQVVTQFLGEAVLMALLALVLALATVEILLPAFDSFLQRPIGFHYMSDWPLLLGFIAIAVVAGLVSGLYPALVLSGFRPAATLRSNRAGQSGSGALRNILVVLQFAVSIGLGIAAAVVFAQIQYARNIDLGFHRDNIVVINQGRLNVGQRAAFVRALRADPGILAVGETNRPPLQVGQSLATFRLPGSSQDVFLNGNEIDPDLPKTLGIKLVAGRMLSEDRADDRLHSDSPGHDPLNDGKNLLVNVSGAKRLGFTPQEAIGKAVTVMGSPAHIVGVLADFKIHGALEPVPPSFYVYVPTDSMQFVAHLDPRTLPQTLQAIDRTWHDFSPDVAISRYFLDDAYAKFYAASQRQGTMFAIFVGIAIFIACLGLFGLAAFTAGRRTKEIGIRKVFGARAHDVIFLLLWQFSIPVLIANAIAWPLAWYYLHGWLQGFAYRIGLSPLFFIGAGLVALIIAWATIFAHAWRVAHANPIRALRYE